jgi:hypothetical protein
MLIKLAFGPVLVIAVLGAVFVGLDMLDIVEVYELPLPVPILNTAFISGIAVPIVYITTRNWTATGWPQALWLGSGVLAFGVGSLLYGWLPDSELNARITVHEGAALIASALHLTGVVLATAAPRPPNPRLWRRPWIVPLLYLGILAGIALLTLLALRGMTPPFQALEGGFLLRTAVRTATTAFFLASSVISLRTYFKLQAAFHLWYSAGLMLFALGSLLLSLSAVEGLIAWLGRGAQYAGGVYFMVAALRLARIRAPRGQG